MVGKRRIDRVTDPELPGRIADLETPAVRELRDDCRDEEAHLSYLRRLLHARLDIARAEVERRGHDLDALLGRLPHILSQHRGGSREPRSVRVYLPEDDTPRRRRADRVLDDPGLANLPEFDDEQVQTLISNLTEYEREVSGSRATVLEHLDLLQGELVARYRDGRASIDEVLSSSNDA